ncbi:nicotinamide-nucleotide adenylyltransferase [Thermoproteus tenax]|uniref:Nicotinamide-nucleotide adenylyltransferase n=1 Tax=Thermoproteus tenax (strain ATCC 35583 / DSM 2078 / JCM 9277 / NBRC 100435 / Kra 1) TaxID=768679 RepID=G4RKX9_THETK|nr:nicotinamide-nucleotide adenylyltransferase [Thermoproteus tenax]CCC82224.1 nicotinamide-nucleotide adenylyltransferase [Thermoproteus tenax Kra 1]
MRVAFIGRFQPLHLGHAKVIEWLTEKYDDVLIVIGSADKGLTKDNPFTAGERIEMFYRTFGRRLAICTVPDTGGLSSLWGAYIRHWCPPFSIAFSNNNYVKVALSYAGIEVRTHPLFERERYSGRRIRQMMATGNGEWRKLVPDVVASFIDEVGGSERVRLLFEEG